MKIKEILCIGICTIIIAVILYNEYNRLPIKIDKLIEKRLPAINKMLKYQSKDIVLEVRGGLLKKCKYKDVEYLCL